MEFHEIVILVLGIHFLIGLGDALGLKLYDKSCWSIAIKAFFAWEYYIYQEAKLTLKLRAGRS